MENDGLQIMLSELESHRLHVVLVPLNPKLRNYNEGGMKRVCLDKSPRWYSSFCARHLSSRKRNHRKVDTRIKRQGVIEILSRMCVGKTTTSKYAAEFRSIAQKIAA